MDREGLGAGEVTVRGKEKQMEARGPWLTQSSPEAQRQPQ